MTAPAKLKRGPGRPRFAEGEARGRIFALRLSDAEREAVEAAAKRAGARSASDWARDVPLAAAHVAGGS